MIFCDVSNSCEKSHLTFKVLSIIWWTKWSQIYPDFKTLICFLKFFYFLKTAHYFINVTIIILYWYNNVHLYFIFDDNAHVNTIHINGWYMELEEGFNISFMKPMFSILLTFTYTLSVFPLSCYCTYTIHREKIKLQRARLTNHASVIFFSFKKRFQRTISLSWNRSDFCVCLEDI